LIVLDASAAVDWLLDTRVGLQIEQRIAGGAERVHAPHLIDIEVAQVLRRYARDKTLTDSRAEAALYDLADIPITRYSHSAFMPRVWQLRHNFTAYDSLYIALAEALDVPLLTRDKKLAAGPGHSARVELF
jgi:predicted nucleic acid-binding protein